MRDIKDARDGTYSDHANLFEAMGIVTSGSYAALHQPESEPSEAEKAHERSRDDLRRQRKQVLRRGREAWRNYA